jgi:hypothetical protein
MGKAAWPEIERLLGEIRQALDQMTLDEDALILEATVEITEHRLCHAASGLRYSQQPSSQANEENQLPRVSIPA